MYHLSSLAKEKIIILILLCLIHNQGLTQTCTALGQTPETAIPVCGTDTLFQSPGSYCDGGLPGVWCRAPYVNKFMDMSPFYYSFTCFSPGTLGFVITPIDPDDNYSWQLFDITYIGDPNGIFLYPSATI